MGSPTPPLNLLNLGLGCLLRGSPLRIWGESQELNPQSCGEVCSHSDNTTTSLLLHVSKSMRTVQSLRGKFAPVIPKLKWPIALRLPGQDWDAVDRLVWGHSTRAGAVVKNLPANAGDLASISGSGRFPWRRKWQSTPEFLPGESHGQRSLVGYSP